MAEIVNQRIENMLTELEQMKRVELYTPEEIKEIAKKRKEFEYTIHRRTKSKEDFLRYISYECLLLKDIRLRRENYKIDEKKNDIEYQLAKRISKLFNELLYRFPNDIEIWLNYMKFCKKVNFMTTITSYFEKMLQIHGDKPKMWQLSCRWEYEEMNNIDNARKILLKGIHRHPKDHDLYIDALRIELLVAEAIKDEDQRKKQLIRADLILTDALEQIDDVKFITKACGIVDDFDFESSFREKLFRKLWNEHSHETEAWNFIAKCELEGRDVSGFDWRSLSDDFLADDTNINKFVNVYEVALEKKNIENLCIDYINNAIMLINNDIYSINLRMKIINGALKKGHILKRLGEDHYKIWIDILRNDTATNNKELDKILEEACKYLPSSQYIWVERLKRFVNKSEEMFKIFKLARRALSAENVSPVWVYVVENTKNINKLRKLREETMTLIPSAAARIRPLLLKAFYKCENVNTARNEYSLMSIMPPFALEVHEAMIEIEFEQKSKDIKRIRNCYEMAVQQFGTKNCELWLGYVGFESKTGQPERCGLVYARACSNLDRSVVDKFISDYSLMV